MKTQNTFTSIRKHLEQQTSRELVKLIGELFALNKQNKLFLQGRFSNGSAVLEASKNAVEKALYPDITSRSQTLSFRAAKKAISDYKKATNDSLGVTELMVFATECGNRYTCEFGDIDAPFYDSLCLMFKNACESVLQLEQSSQKDFVVRLTNVVRLANGIGWGYYDDISEMLSEYFTHFSEK